MSIRFGDTVVAPTVVKQTGISSDVALVLQQMTERKTSVIQEFAYDGQRYGVIDLSSLDDTPYAIRDIGQRALNGLAYANDGGTNRTLRIIMPSLLPLVSGTNWCAVGTVKYYDFGKYSGSEPPVYTSSLTSVGAAFILVPTALADAWKTATGWASMAEKIIGVEEDYD